MFTKGSPEDWGWKLHDGRYIPLAVDDVIAPDEIHNIV
jgi:hypothetical protein